MKTTLSTPQILLLLAALLAPVFGGYVVSDATTVDPVSLVAGMGEGQAPVLQHVLLALPVFAAMVLLLLRRRVQQIPYPYVALALMLFVASLAPAVATSSYRAVAVGVWVEWAAYAVAFLAVVSGLGRRMGPVALLGAVFAGTAWIARIGVFEYLDMRRIDPNWRVFCGWNNPNAAAAMLVLGFLCALGLPRAKERSLDLVLNLAVVVGGGLVVGALFLTGSKGGTLLALPTGLVAFGLLGGRRHPAIYPVAALVLALSAASFLKAMPLLGIGAAILFAVGSLWGNWVPVGRMAGAFAFGTAMLFFFASTTPGGAAPTTGGSRISAAASTQDQSATFRLNLWKSAVALTKERPVTGWGLGSYRYESARPGLATATVFSHDSYLQLAAEAGLGSLTLFLAFLGLWARRAFRGSSRLPGEQRLAFAAAAGGAASVLAHCLVDSDLSYFGLGLAFFLVLGAASLLAADAVAPEFVPKNSRFLAAGGIAALWGAFAYFAWADLAKSEVRFAQENRQPGDLASLEGLAAWDGDAAYLWAMGQPSEEAREAGLKRALEMQPTPKFARALASSQERSGDYAGAEASLKRGLLQDRLNLRALEQLMRVQEEEGLPERAQETARRMLAVEATPYYRVRSLDEVVPTETYLARATLADAEPRPAEKARLLAEAVEGLRRYAEVTVPAVLKAAKGGASNFAGETMDRARDRVEIGTKRAREAAALFRKLGDPKRAAEMDDAATTFAKAIPPE